MITQREQTELERLINGQWADCDTICKLLHITFSTGLKIFEFSRTAAWNKAPLNGEKIDTRFRLRSEAKDVFTKTKM